MARTTITGSLSYSEYEKRKATGENFSGSARIYYQRPDRDKQSVAMAGSAEFLKAVKENPNLAVWFGKQGDTTDKITWIDSAGNRHVAYEGTTAYAQAKGDTSVSGTSKDVKAQLGEQTYSQLKQEQQTGNSQVTPQQQQQIEETQAGPGSFRDLDFIDTSQTQVSPTIDLTNQYQKPADTGKPRSIIDFARIREQDGLYAGIVRAATSWKTTAVLATVAASLGVGLLMSPAAAASTRVIDPALKGLSSVGTTIAKRQAITKAVPRLVGLIGKAPVKVAVTNLGTAGRFAVNSKTTWATTSFLVKAGMSLGAAAYVSTLAGTYPFARFELAEATDKIGLAIYQATEAGDYELADELRAYQEEMLDSSFWERVLSVVPFANIHVKATKNIAAAQKSAAAMGQIIDKKRREASGEIESEFAAQRRMTDEAAREREVAQRTEDEAYYAGQREQRAGEETARKETERKEEEEYWNRIREENARRKEEDRKAEEEYWARIKAENEKAKQETPSTPSTPSQESPYTPPEGTEKVYNYKTQKWESPSSLGFGLLKTSGYYEDLEEEEEKKKKKKKKKK